MRFAKKVDRNHSSIRDSLRSMGYEVHDLSAAGDGVPDLMVKIKPGKPFFLEVKDGDKPKSAQGLTKAQEQWHNFAWQITGKVNSLEEAVLSLEWAKANWQNTD